MFFESCGVLVPDVVRPTWTDLSSCVWNGPPETIKMHSLKRLYMSRIKDAGKRKDIEKFLHTSLGIQNTTVNTLASELLELRRLRCEDPRRILGIYQYWNAELDVNPETRFVVVYHVIGLIQDANRILELCSKKLHLSLQKGMVAWAGTRSVIAFGQVIHRLVAEPLSRISLAI
jgi:hypothetical protein